MENKRIRNLSLEGAGILLIVLFIATSFVFSHTGSSRKDLSVIVENNVRDVMVDYETEIGGTVSVINTSAVLLTDSFRLNPYMNDSAKVTLLADVVDKTDLYKALFCDLNGTALDEAGDKYNITSTEYYSRLSGTASFFVLVNDDGFGNGEAIVLVSPIVDGANKTGYILLFLDTDVVKDVFAGYSYYNYSFYAILDADQNVLFSTGRSIPTSLMNGRLWDNVRLSADTNSSWVIFDQKTRGSQKASLYITTETDRRYVISAPISGTSWAMLMGTEVSYLDRELNQFTDSDVVLKIAMLICFAAILIVYIVICILLNSHAREKNRELEGKADTDLLTGLSNKIATENAIQKYIENHPDGCGVMILIDLDNFKKINDTMGHAFGDEVLKNLGIRLRSLYRISDIIGRLGGDEFVVFLKDISDPGVIEREARKLEVFFYGFEVGEYVKYSVTASLGAAVFSTDGTSFAELYKNADHALYEAKHRGKNQLVYFKDLDRKNLKSNKATKVDSDGGAD